jgi:hypothetical protein
VTGGVLLLGAGLALLVARDSPAGPAAAHQLETAHSAASLPEPSPPPAASAAPPAAASAPAAEAAEGAARPAPAARARSDGPRQRAEVRPRKDGSRAPQGRSTRNLRLKIEAGYDFPEGAERVFVWFFQLTTGF